VRLPPRPGLARIEDRRGLTPPPPIMTALQRLTPEREDTRDPALPPIPTRARAALLPRQRAPLGPREKRALLHYLSIRYQQALTRKQPPGTLGGR
jgi:hypothetical protein